MPHDPHAEARQLLESVFVLDPAPPAKPGARFEVGDIAYHEDEQDPTLLTDAGRLAYAQARALERAYVGEVMAAEAYYSLWALTNDDKDRECALRHEGAADMLALLCGELYLPVRERSDLDPIAERLMSARAGKALRTTPSRPLREVLQPLAGRYAPPRRGA